MFRSLFLHIFLLCISNTLVAASFEEDAQRSINEKRSLHNCAPLKYEAELDGLAAKIAATIVHGGIPLIPEDVGMNYGVLLGNSEVDQSAESLINHWYHEKRFYNFNAPEKSMNNEEFIQMIWNSTQSFGIASMVRDSRSTLVVALFRPKADMANFQENIPMPTRSAQGTKQNMAQKMAGSFLKGVANAFVPPPQKKKKESK